VLHAGRSAVDVALYTLLPIMVLMMIVLDSMNRLEAKRQFSAVAQMVGFGPRRSKMPYLSMGVD
jgi:uncharacterized membrane protein YqjE